MRRSVENTLRLVGYRLNQRVPIDDFVNGKRIRLSSIKPYYSGSELIFNVEFYWLLYFD